MEKRELAALIMVVLGCFVAGIGSGESSWLLQQPRSSITMDSFCPLFLFPRNNKHPEFLLQYDSVQFGHGELGMVCKWRRLSKIDFMGEAITAPSSHLNSSRLSPVQELLALTLDSLWDRL